MKNLLLLLLVLAFSILQFKANDSLETIEIGDSAYQEAIENYQRYLDSINSTFHYQYGTIQLKDDLASIQVPKGYKYLDGETGERILTQLWGNPPSAEEDKSLGMLLKEDQSPMSDSAFAINITYSEEGYINDEDAKDIDYEDLLEGMKEDMEAANEYRTQEGYPKITLIGWASPPFYDSESKKLHWAKELYFEGYDENNTLNYNIRILGRRGYLQLNVIGEMYVLDEVKQDINSILASVNFNDGNRYADFNPEIDEVAAYGIGGLIAGKILAKAGILAKFGVLLAKFWKVIVIAIAGIAAGAKKFFFGKKE